MLYHANVLVTACDGRTSPGTVVVPSLEVLPDNLIPCDSALTFTRVASASENPNADRV